MTRLHRLGSKLMAPGDANAMLEEVLRAAVEITVAEKGYVQISDEAGALTSRRKRVSRRRFSTSSPASTRRPTARALGDGRVESG